MCFYRILKQRIQYLAANEEETHGSYATSHRSGVSARDGILCDRAFAERKARRDQLSNLRVSAAQPSFIEGVKELHSFQFDEAALAFQKAEQLDPNFAMAYWGEAMSHNHPLWAEVDVDKAKQALEKLAPTLDARVAKARRPRKRPISAPSISSSIRPVTSWLGTTRTPRRCPKCTQSGPMTTKSTFYALSILGTVRPGDTGFRRQAWPRPSL